MSLPGYDAWKTNVPNWPDGDDCPECGGCWMHLEVYPDGDEWLCDDCNHCWRAETIMGRREPWMDL